MEKATIEYWAGYNEDGASSIITRTGLLNALKDAQDEWNRGCDKGSEIIELEPKVISTAEEFFDAAGYISVDIILAMITQL